jgi:hypothetical protein
MDGAFLRLNAEVRSALFSARSPAIVVSVGESGPLNLSGFRNSKSLHFFFAAAILPSGNAVKSGYNSSEVRRPAFPEEMTPPESGLKSSGGTSFCIAKTSFQKSGQFGDRSICPCAVRR